MVLNSTRRNPKTIGKEKKNELPIKEIDLVPNKKQSGNKRVGELKS